MLRCAQQNFTIFVSSPFQRAMTKLSTQMWCKSVSVSSRRMAVHASLRRRHTFNAVPSNICSCEAVVQRSSRIHRLLSVAMEQRTRGVVANTASEEKIVKVLRGCLPGGPDSKVLAVTDMDQLVESHVDLMSDLLKATPRPTKKLLRKGAIAAWRYDVHEADFFASRMVAAFTYCRAKDNGATSCKKLQKGVATIVMLLRAASRTRKSSAEAVQRSPRKQTAETRSPRKKTPEVRNQPKKQAEPRSATATTDISTCLPRSQSGLKRACSDGPSPKAGRRRLRRKTSTTSEGSPAVKLPVTASSVLLKSFADGIQTLKSE
jgi:hypothetical protein